MLSAAMKPARGRDSRRGGGAPRMANGRGNRESAPPQGMERMLFAGQVQQGYEVQLQVLVLVQLACLRNRTSEKVVHRVPRRPFCVVPLVLNAASRVADAVC